MQMTGWLHDRSLILKVIMVLIILFTAIPSLHGLEDASSNLVFEGSTSFSSSPYLKNGEGTEANPYLISDVNIGAHNLQIKNSTAYVVFRNITFSRAPSWAIYLYSARNIIFHNVSVVDRGEVIFAYNSRNLLFTDCNFSSIKSASSSFEFQSALDVTIRDSVFTEDAVTGAGRIHFNNAGGGHIFQRNRCIGVPYEDERFLGTGEISNSTFLSSPVTVARGDSGGFVSDNVFDHPSGDALTLSYTYRIRVSDNFFRGVNGIYFYLMSWQWDFTPGVIENNTFESCGVGIGSLFNWNTRTTQYHIHHNYFGNCTGYAINLNYGNYINIWRNIFYHNAGTDNSTPGDQASQSGVYQTLYPNLWTVGKLGNFWANHRVPDADNDGITDFNYSVPVGSEDHRPSANPYFDTVPPSLQVVDPPPGQYPRSYIRVRWNAVDMQSGLDRVELSLDQGPFVNITGKDHHSLFLPKGEHDLEMRAHDRAGLYNLSSFKVLIDETESVADLQVPIDGFYYNTDTIRIAWEIEDYFHPVNLSLKIDGEWLVLPTSAKYLTRTFSQGIHKVVLHLEDDDGLVFDIPSTFHIDLTPPGIEVISPTAGSVLSNSNVYFNFTVSDNFGVKKVEMRFDGEPYRDRSGEYSFTEFLSPGIHQVNIRAFDLSGLMTNVTYSFRIGGETGLLIVSPGNGTFTRNNSVLLQWDYQGPFQWSRSFIRLGKGIFEDTGGSKTRELFLNADGQYRMTVRLEDEFKNYIENSTWVIRDTLAPRVEFKTPMDASYVNNNTVQFEWLGLDPGGMAISRYYLDVDDSGWIDMGQNISAPLYLEEGKHTIAVRAVDLAGNSGEKSITITIDTVPPLLKFLSPVAGAFIKDSFTEFSWEATDNTELANLTLVIDGRIRIQVLGRDSYSTSIGTDGEHLVSLIGEDAAGNIFNLTVSIMVDLKVPEVKWLIVPEGYTNKRWVNLYFSASDEFGISNLSLVVNGNHIYLDDNSTTYNLTLEERSYELSLAARDLAGWERTLMSVELVVDLTDPTVDIDMGRSYVKGRTATVYWTSYDGNSGIGQTLIDIDGEGFAPVFSGNLHSFDGLLGGDHVITVRVVDKAGNVEEDRWLFSMAAVVDDDNSDDGSIPSFVWVAMGLVAFFLLFIVVGIVVSKRRSRLDPKTSITQVKRPDRLEIQIPSRAFSSTIAQPASMETRGGQSVYESTDEGSGYIRPEKERKREKRIIEAPGTTEDDVESGPVGGAIQDEEEEEQGHPMDDIDPGLPLEEEPFTEEDQEEIEAGEIPGDIPTWDEDMQEEIQDWEEVDEYDEMDDIEEWDE
ncbi:MAG: Ig-like domain-containing protein [Thermoplasmatota archaeon]